MVLNKTRTESDVICDAIGERTFRASEEWFNQELPEDYKTTHGSVHNWVVGKYEPMDKFVRALQIFYPVGDPRHKLGKTLAEMRLAKTAGVK